MIEQIARGHDRDQALAVVQTADCSDFRQIALRGPTAPGIASTPDFDTRSTSLTASTTTPTETPLSVSTTMRLFSSRSLCGQAEHAAQADQRQQAVAQGHHAQHMRLRMRHMNDRLRHLHDLLHVLDGDGVLLALDIEAHQLQFVAGSSSSLCAWLASARHRGVAW